MNRLFWSYSSGVLMGIAFGMSIMGGLYQLPTTAMPAVALVFFVGLLCFVKSWRMKKK